MEIIKYFVVVAVMVAGCTPASRQPTYKVSGDVQLNGKPLTGGMVVFMPDQGQAAKGAIHADGTFQLGTYTEEDGAVAGQYKVMVISPDKEAMQQGAAALELPLPSLIPARYGSTATSGLAFEVTPTQSNVAHLMLSSKAQP